MVKRLATRGNILSGKFMVFEIATMTNLGLGRVSQLKMR